MSKFTDQQYLKREQYRDASNLNTRIALHEKFSTNPYGWFHWIFDTLKTLPNPAQVLELGCGPAYMWIECAERIPAGWEITLSDLSAGMLATAQENLAGLSHAFTYREIDAQSIPFDDETFDIVIANHMLFHVADRPKGLAEIKRVLKPGGTLIATTAGSKHLIEIIKWLKQINPGKYVAPFGSPFTLDNGLEQIKPFFSQVEIKRYDDDLRVTEIEPLMAYILSTFRAKDLSVSASAEIREELKDILSQKDEIFITKDSGMFKAVK